VERSEKVTKLLAKADDVRRLALDELDAVARRTNTWGSKEHRAGRDKVEHDYDLDALRFQKLEEEALDKELVG